MARKSRSRRTVWLSILAVAVVVLGGGAFAWFLTPWPKALLVRKVSDDAGWQTNTRLASLVQPGITEIPNVAYRPGDGDAKLDVYYPHAAIRALPTIVWIHGGAWVSGSKEQEANYYRILAAKGFVVIGVGYSLAPEKQYPVPVRQLNAALGFLRAHAATYHVNPNALFLAGDSAGSQITAQEAALLTSPSYASLMGITPSVPASSIAGTLLNCGPYSLDVARQPGDFAEFIKTTLWSYTGTKKFLNDPRFQSASVINYVTKDFPPSFITAGNGDPLESQSTQLASKLSTMGVTVDTKFFAKDHTPAQPHEYQMFLWNKEGMDALNQMVQFIRNRSPS
jgi:acetyl esterase